MRYYFVTAICCFSLIVMSQQDITVFYEKNARGYTLYAGNLLACPVSISLDLDLQNLIFSPRDQKVFLIPPGNEKFKLGVLRIQDYRIPNKFLFHFNGTVGDVNVQECDTTYQYDLPFRKGQEYLIFQVYNGMSSHKNINALDFKMPEGTAIVAAREGVVIKVVQENNISCPEEACAQFNNYIEIYHPDGSIGLYALIRYQGSTVKAGDSVKRGDVIAYSGNTGWSTGPHLLFSCVLPGFGNKRSVMTKFKINDGSLSDYLQEKQTYLKNY